jgi:7-cyano-7-deazaguanine synthase
VLLLSGGLDSATLLAWACHQGYQVHALSVSYGQHSESELRAASRLAEYFRIADHRIIRVELDQFGGSALLGDRTVPDSGQAATRFGIPETYVPARNTIFLSLALGWAEVLGAHTLLIGANAVDYSGYPDCRPAFIQAFNALAALAVAEGSTGGRPIRVETPLMNLSKAQIVALGNELNLPFELTVSCYDADPQGRACGRCDSCVLRRNGFAEAGIEDPIVYRHEGP